MPAKNDGRSNSSGGSSRSSTATATATATEVRAYPAPSPLATPTDLKTSDVKAIVEAVNPLIADSFALYVKSKHFHWHLFGPHFRDYHLLFDEQAESILDGIDPLAERLRKIGGTTIRSISHIAALQTIDDDNEVEIPAPKMLNRLLNDNLRMAEAQRAAIDTCEDHNDSVTANLLQEVLDGTERRIWFLHEAMQRG
jgi:starvation-inducible DNA-binding protein